MPIIELFPTAVGLYHLNRSLTPAELQCLITLERKPNHHNAVSTDSFVLNKPPLVHLKQWIDEQLAEHMCTVYSPRHAVHANITQSWVNYTGPGESHHKHAHKNSFLSAVFYVQSAVNQGGRIIFYRGHERELDMETDQLNACNASTFHLSVQDLDLVIFPSNLVHAVEPVTGAQHRISLALNTFLSGQLGDVNKLSWLQLP